MSPEVSVGGPSSSVGEEEPQGLVSNLGGSRDPLAPDSPGSLPRGPVVWASSSFGWDDTWDMEDRGDAVAGTGGERFSGRAGGLSVTDLRLGHENKLQLLRARRSVTAATLTDEDKFAVLLELCSDDAYHVIQDRFRDRRLANTKDREETEAKNLAMEQKVAKEYHEKMALPDAVLTAVPTWPRLVPKGDNTLMQDAWTFLETTWPEQSARSLSDYHNFAYVKDRSTHATFHFLRELCRKNGKPVVGREITEKALKALRKEVRGALEDGVLKWSAAECTLERLEKDARQVEDALHTRDLERAAQTVVKTVTQKVEQLSITKSNPRPADDNRQRQERNPGGQAGRKGRGKGKAKQAYAVTATPAKGQGGDFPGNCNRCGEWGHKQADCRAKPKDGAGAGPRKPGAHCKHCDRRDSHDSNECWQKYPEKRPDSWKQRGGGGAKPAYAMGEVEEAEEGDPGNPEHYDSFYAWSAVVPEMDLALLGIQEPAMVFDGEGPEVRDSTKAQRDTEPAARAKGERERLAARAKEERLRKGGPPPAFLPKGTRDAPDPGEDTNEGDQEGPGEDKLGGAAELKPAQKLPPSFGEYPVTDPRYQGLDAQEQAGVRPSLVAVPAVGPQREVQVRRPEPFEVVAAAAQYTLAAGDDLGHLVVSVGAPMRCRGGGVDSDDDDEPGEDEAAALLAISSPGATTTVASTGADVTGADMAAGTTVAAATAAEVAAEETTGAATGPPVAASATTAAETGAGAETPAPEDSEEGSEEEGLEEEAELESGEEGPGEEGSEEESGEEGEEEESAGEDPNDGSGEETGGGEEGEEEEEEDSASEHSGDADIDPDQAELTRIPQRFRYFPPAQLPEKGEKGITKHLGVMAQGYADGAPVGRPQHRGQGWLKAPSWGNMHQGDFEGYILWWGRWMATYERYRHLREIAGGQLPAEDKYVLDALHQVGDSLKEFFRSNRHVNNTTKPDLTHMVKIHEYLAEPPVANKDQDYSVRLGPLPEEELAGGDARGAKDFMRVPLSLLQAYFAARYGPNWLEGFIRSVPVPLPAGQGRLYCQRRYPNIKPAPIDINSKPIATNLRRRKEPYTPILKQKHWDWPNEVGTQVGWPPLSARDQAETDAQLEAERKTLADQREQERRGGQLRSAVEETAVAAAVETEEEQDLEAAAEVARGPVPTSPTGGARQRLESRKVSRHAAAEEQQRQADMEAAAAEERAKRSAGLETAMGGIETPPGDELPSAERALQEFWRVAGQGERAGAEDQAKQAQELEAAAKEHADLEAQAQRDAQAEEEAAARTYLIMSRVVDEALQGAPAVEDPTEATQRKADQEAAARELADSEARSKELAERGTAVQTEEEAAEVEHRATVAEFQAMQTPQALQDAAERDNAALDEEADEDAAINAMAEDLANRRLRAQQRRAERGRTIITSRGVRPISEILPSTTATSAGGEPAHHVNH